MNEPREAGRRARVTAAAALAAVLVLALALRLKGITWGLPYSFVNADESVVVPIGAQVARGHLDPGFFFYPSFFFYLLGALYLAATPVLWLVKHADPLTLRAFTIDQGPYFLLGRLLSGAFGTAAVYLLYRLGRASFGRVTGLLAAVFLAVSPLAVAYSHMAVTDMAATSLALLALLLLYLAAQGRGRRWLLAGAVAAGLATSTKYNLGMLVLPATVAAVYVCRAEVARRVAGGARAARVWARLLAARVYAPMLLAFVAGSPFVIFNAPRFVGDFIHQNRIMAAGWLGFEHSGNGFWYNLHANLGPGIGAVLVVLGVAGLAVALWRRTRFDLIVAPYVVVYFAYVSTWKELADRYLLPIVPLLLLLAARCVVELAGLRPAWRRVTVPIAALVVLAACALPLAAAVSFDHALSGTDVRALAKTWVERTIPSGSVVALENYGPQLVPVSDQPYYREAGLRQPAYDIVRLALPVPGAPDTQHTMAWLRANHARYVVISSRVYARVMAAAADYPAVAAFYRELQRTGRLVKVFRPGAGRRGPVLKVYELPPGQR